MPHQTTTDLLDRAAAKYAAAERPTVARLHRELKSDVMSRNDERANEGLAPLACPSLSTLRRRVGLLDPRLVAAARRGSAVPRFGDRSGSGPAGGRGRTRSDGRRRPGSWRVEAERRIVRLQGTVELLMGVLEGGGDAPDLVRASMLLAAQDRLARYHGSDPVALDCLRGSIDHFLLKVAWTWAATPDDLRRRVRLFGRRQEHGDDIVGIALANSVERDRRRLRLSLTEVA